MVKNLKLNVGLMKQQKQEKNNRKNSVLKKVKFLNFKFYKVIILLGVMTLFSCENSIVKIKSLPENIEMPDVVAKNIEILQSDSGLVKINIFAKEINVYNESKTRAESKIIFPKGIDVKIYNKSKEITSTIKADYAIYYESKKLWEATYNVIAENKIEKRTVNTEQLFWDESEEKIYSDKFVRVIYENGEMCGTEFHANQDFSNWKINNIENSNITIEDEKKDSIL